MRRVEVSHGNVRSRVSAVAGVVWRAGPMPLAMASLAAALWTSLTRLGWSVSGFAAINHGPLMVGGFIGAVIALERAVALGRPWGYVAPWLSAVSALFLMLPMPMAAAAWTLFLSSIALLVIFAAFLKVQWSDFTAVMAVGALCWSVGNGLFVAGRPFFELVPWWAGFLILTIAGERIEMSRLSPRPRSSQWVIAGVLALYFATLVWGAVDLDVGARLNGAALIALALWFLRYDIARRTVRLAGLPRYAAISIFAGYAWLIAAGVLGIAWGKMTAGLRYDAWIHAQFVGFVFGMIMAHAPIILPAVAGVEIKFTRLFYAPVAVMHVSLAVRVVADVMSSSIGRQWSGVFNIAAVLLFVVVVVQAALRARKEVASDRH